ncbi:MAG: DUF6331 family protein [Sediminibacterium sp.]|nr:DUF6331 family protein [Sediminibacterium sp.]
MAQCNDIRIDENRWLKWIELDTSQASHNIDTLLEPTLPFWTLLETECVSECCGIDAFNFWPDTIKQAKAKLNDVTLIPKIETLKNELLTVTNNIIDSSFLNNLFDKAFFILLLDYLLQQLNEPER